MNLTIKQGGKDVTITLTKEQLNEIAKQTKSGDITDRIKSIDDVYRELGVKRSDVIPYYDPVDNHQRFVNACVDIKHLVECLNEGIILDFNNTSQYKWLPYKYLSGGRLLVDFSSFSYCFAGSGFHYYKSEKLAKHGYNICNNIYGDFWSFNK